MDFQLLLSVVLDWEVRVNQGGQPLYYDHSNQRVCLDRPDTNTEDGTVTTPTGDLPLGSLQHFLAR